MKLPKGITIKGFHKEGNKIGVRLLISSVYLGNACMKLSIKHLIKHPLFSVKAFRAACGMYYEAAKGN